MILSDGASYFYLVGKDAQCDFCILMQDVYLAI